MIKMAMNWIKVFSSEAIEYPFFIEMGNERGGHLPKDLFSRQEYFYGCCCLSCGKSKAVMKRTRRNDSLLLLCPVETCSQKVKVLTLDDPSSFAALLLILGVEEEGTLEKLFGELVADQKPEEMIWVQNRGGCIKVKYVCSC